MLLVEAGVHGETDNAAKPSGAKCVEAWSPVSPVPLDLVALLASRLCHDLAGLAGTLTGALDLVDEAPDETAEAIALSREAAGALSLKLRLVRTAWGLATEALDVAGLTALAAALPGAPRVRLDASALPSALVFDPMRAKVLLNALILAAESLRGGGTIRLEGEAGSIRVGLEGPRHGWPPGLGAHLADPDGAARAALADGPRGLQAPLLALLARDAGVSIVVPDGNSPGSLRILWSLPLTVRSHPPGSLLA